ncbi:MAG: tetratricopeptide repeat protein [Verrucomicrobia bacterium]|nr:tetratricopeptide repeat protein [Verrucomicrobiota bacterium]
MTKRILALLLACLVLGGSYSFMQSWPGIRVKAEMGDAKAQLRLGFRYEEGEGVQKNMFEAVKWCRMAAERGYARAQIYLGIRYHVGSGMARDDAEALNWLRKPAEHGDAEGQRVMGMIYKDGEGVPRDAVEAYKWLNLSAAQEDDFAISQRNELERTMTSEQVEAAQKLSREWRPKPMQ